MNYEVQRYKSDDHDVENLLLNGRLHRIDGLAIIWSKNGKKIKERWYRFGLPRRWPGTIAINETVFCQPKNKTSPRVFRPSGRQSAFYYCLANRNWQRTIAKC